MTDVTTRLQRRIQNIYHLCYTTVAANDSGAVMTAQMAPVPFVQTFGFSSSPPVNSLCIRVNMSGDATSGIAIGSVHQASRPTGLTEGQSQQYDQGGSKILLSNDGLITFMPQKDGAGNLQMVMSTTTVDLTAPASVNMTTAALRVSGNIFSGTGWSGVAPLGAGKSATFVMGRLINVY
jgi:phage gp45-like